MGTAPKKPRAMRSRRSGIKKSKMVKSNLGVLTKLEQILNLAKSLN